MPWLEAGHSYSSLGPPQPATKLPSGSNSTIGGAGRQHSPVGGSAAAPTSVRGFKLACRWITNTWSRESTPTPTTEPNNQWLGNGFGQNGSTSKRGASTCPWTAFRSTQWAPAPNPAIATASAAAAAGVRLLAICRPP